MQNNEWYDTTHNNFSNQSFHTTAHQTNNIGTAKFGAMGHIREEDSQMYNPNSYNYLQVPGGRSRQNAQMRMSNMSHASA